MSFRDKKILIIDGHPVYIYKIEGFLKGLTFENVHLCPHAQDGIKEVERQQPDLIILSGMLPDADSRFVCKKIKEINPATKIIVQIGLFTELALIEDFKSSGADAIVPRKEKDLNPLQEKIEALLGLNRA